MNQAQMMKWGLIPFWAKDPEIGNRSINARAETVDERPMFRQAFLRRRHYPGRVGIRC
jgi:putative SOS response-associated peptidase YedK